MDLSYIVDYLSAVVGPSINGYGLTDDRVNKRTEAEMMKAFRRAVCGLRKGEGGYIKADDDDQLYIYNGKWFERCERSEESLREIIRRVMELQEVGVVYQMGSPKLIADACMDRLLVEGRCRFAPDRRWVVFRNGVFDTETGVLSDFDIKYETDIVLDYDYDAGARSALWDGVLLRTVPDEGMRETFHQFCGCFLAKREDYKIESLCFVVGEGKNGKSVICRAVVNALGRGVASSYSPQQLFRGGNQSEYHLADVNGKIVNFCDDVSNVDFSGGEMKSFVSGGEFTGRHPYSRRPTKVTKVPLMLCCANRIPPTTDDTDGYYRRFIIVNAPNKVDERDMDVTLESKLAADDVRSAIFNWMYSGYRAFVANGGKIEISATVKDVVEEMKNNANSLRRWITECNYGRVEPTGPEDPNWKPLKEWMRIYREYCEGYGEVPKNRSAVTELFGKMGLERKRTSTGTWFCMGVVPDGAVYPDDLPPEEPDVAPEEPEEYGGLPF